MIISGYSVTDGIMILTLFGNMIHSGSTGS